MNTVILMLAGGAIVVLLLIAYVMFIGNSTDDIDEHYEIWGEK